jgi:hypothetical protein
VLNFTNQQNWAVVSINNGTNQAYPEMPLQAQGTIREGLRRTDEEKPHAKTQDAQKKEEKQTANGHE